MSGPQGQVGEPASPLDGSRWLISTERLALRRLDHADGPFLLSLLNETLFLRFVGDREVRDLEDARLFIEHAVLASYRRFGFGPWLVTARSDGRPVGMCGLYLRDYLQVPDLGYAIHVAHRGRGFAREAAQAVLDYAAEELGIGCVLGLVAPDNLASSSVLRACGMARLTTIRAPGVQSDSDLYAPSGLELPLARVLGVGAEIIEPA